MIPDRRGLRLSPLRAQTIASEIELVLIRLGLGPALEPGLVEAFWGVQQITDDGRTFGEVRSAAVVAAKASVVAFLEDHCLAEPHWAEVLAGCIEQGWTGVGCEMYNANKSAGISQAVGLMNYGVYLAPAVRVETYLIPGHNGAYLRSALMALGDDLPVFLRSDTALNEALARRGGRLLLEPRAKVAHANETSLAAILAGYYYNTRAMVATRSQQFGWGAGQRWARILLWWAVPVIRLARLYTAVIRSRSDLIWPTMVWTPVMALAWLSTGIGQAVALVFGIGDADRKFLEYEAYQVRTMNFPGWPDP